jgi:hypothetical protein
MAKVLKEWLKYGCNSLAIASLQTVMIPCHKENSRYVFALQFALKNVKVVVKSRNDPVFPTIELYVCEM